jgi:hypothetical protein
MTTKQDTELQLFDTIKALHSELPIPFDSIDVGITLWKMSDEQCTDLAAMIRWMQDNCDKSEYIIGQVYHDLNGLKAGFLGLPEGDCFSPRSSGYATKI